MNCGSCGGRMVNRIATTENPYHYTLCGLKNVMLAGITIRRCLGCGAESPIIPAIPELHELIAESCLRKNEKLNGEEIRFLRKHVELSAKHFAALLGVDQSYLSRIENGHTKSFGAQADKLARAVVMAVNKQPYGRKVVQLLAEERLKNNTKKKMTKAPLFFQEHNHWRASA